MKKQYFNTLIHGGDYNPEQWLDSPEILEKDIEYFKNVIKNKEYLSIACCRIFKTENLKNKVYRF